MENINIYENIGKRTGGDIYIGVVGPVRAGKSTFIKRFMDLMVIPNVKNAYEKQRLIDEMPQSGTGRTVMTTEPKFIPADAAELQISGSLSLKVRMVDCVGYMIPGALGQMEDGVMRMVDTPWSDEKIPFEEAAEIGTEKVIREHSTVGIVVTTDGTIGTLERSSYEAAEEKVIRQLVELRKPFVIILNSTEPSSDNAAAVAAKMEEKYGMPVMRMNCARAGEDEIDSVMAELLGRFPVREVVFDMPGYMEGLGLDHWLKAQVIERIKAWAGSFDTVAGFRKAAAELADGELIENAGIAGIDMGTGETALRLDMAPDLYYRIVTEMMGTQVNDDSEFFSLLREFAAAKQEYDKLRGAISQVENGGYGIVQPRLSEMTIEEPEVFRQGNKYGVRITAKAPTLHIIKTDITTEISPVVGSEKQSEDLVNSLREEMKESPNGIWDTNIFGKSLYEMVAEQMENKIAGVPDNIRVKMQKSLQKISDEGKEYFICIVI